MSQKHQRTLLKSAAEGGVPGRIAFDYQFLYSHEPKIIKNDDRYKSDYEAASKARENARKTLDITVEKFEKSILLSYVSTSVIFWPAFPRFINEPGFFSNINVSCKRIMKQENDIKELWSTHSIRQEGEVTSDEEEEVHHLKFIVPFL